MNSTVVGGLTLVLVILGIFLAFLWIVLPFAVFKAKDMLVSMQQLADEQNRLIKRQNELLGKLVKDQ
jgi:type II secretory pathway pseudopilin PulG